MDFYLTSGHLLRDLDFLDGPWQVEVPLKMTAETYNFGHDFVIRLLFSMGSFRDEWGGSVRWLMMYWEGGGGNNSYTLGRKLTKWLLPFHLSSGKRSIEDASQVRRISSNNTHEMRYIWDYKCTTRLPLGHSLTEFRLLVNVSGCS